MTFSGYDDKGYYKSAQVCLNGHPTTGCAEDNAEFLVKFCSQCGAKTIRVCPHCNAPIRGEYYAPGVIFIGMPYSPPNYCHECGSPFPWLTEKIAVAVEYAEEMEGLSVNEKAQLKAAIPDLAIDGPRTELAAGRFKRLLMKGGKAVGDGLLKLVVDIASETAKKTILGG